MIKKLLSLAAVAAMSLTASANVNILSSFGTSGWDSSYDATTKTVTYDKSWTGRGWWLAGEGTDYTDYSDYSSIVIEFAQPLEAYAQIVIEYADSSIGDKGSVSSGESAGAEKVEAEFDAVGKKAIKQIYLQSSAAGTIVLKDAYLVENVVEGDFETKDLTLTNDNHNLLLSEYEGYDDDVELDVLLTISNASNPDVAAGWGVGTILRISDYTAAVYNFSAKEVSEEGALNKYKFTVGEFKAFAKLEDGSYWVDSYGQSGVSFNVYNGASVTGVQVQVPVKKDDPTTSVRSLSVDENAPVEVYNLNGVRVNGDNLPAGLYIRRQGQSVSKILVK
jgi:hypothetical protein